MEEKETQVVETVETVETAAPADVKSFRCSAPKADLHTFLIAFLTSAIVIALYHVGLMVYDMCSAEEPEPVYCACHQSSACEEEEEKPRKFEGKKFGGDRQLSPEQRERFRARMERFKKLPPEVQEKVKNMSREERREFFQKLDAKRPPREGRPGRPERREGRRGDAPRPRENAAE